MKERAKEWKRNGVYEHMRTLPQHVHNIYLCKCSFTRFGLHVQMPNPESRIPNARYIYRKCCKHILSTKIHTNVCTLQCVFDFIILFGAAAAAIATTTAPFHLGIRIIHTASDYPACYTFHISIHKCSKNTSNHKNVIEYIFHIMYRSEWNTPMSG